MVLSYVGVISLLMQGFGIGAITTRFPEKAILQFSTVTLTIAYFILVSRHGSWLLKPLYVLLMQLLKMMAFAERVTGL